MNYKSLISENNKDISMGRISFWILLVILIYFWVGKFIFLWIGGVEYADIIKEYFTVPDGLMAAWMLTLTYNAFKKLPMAEENAKVDEIK